jgi:hypothetical protein
MYLQWRDRPSKARKAHRIQGTAAPLGQ